jgi:hypothetical protein
LLTYNFKFSLLHPLQSKVLSNFLLVGLSIVFALLSVELLLRLMLPLETKRRVYQDTRDIFVYHRKHIEFDPEIGIVLRPGLVERSNRTREFSVTISTNSAGFRDDEQSLDRPEILLLGDSFAFGTGVNQEETVGSLMEKMVSRKVLNLGVPTYSNVQEYLSFKRWIDSRGADFRLAVFLLYHNDLPTNVRRSEPLMRPYLDTSGSEFRLVFPTREGYDRWADFVDGRYRPLCHRLYIGYYFARAVALYREPESFTVEKPGGVSIKLGFEKIVDDIAGLAESVDLPVMFAYIPRMLAPDHTDIRHIEKAFRDRSVAFLNLAEVLTAEDYYPLDGHWKPSGHRKAAQALAAVASELIGPHPRSKNPITEGPALEIPGGGTQCLAF